MNVLFALYGDLTTNSAVPLALHARELQRMGHRCAVAIPGANAPAARTGDPALRVLGYGEALADPGAVFPDGPADVLHAWTPREGVRRFVTAYLVKRPTPWVIYLEDNEDWIARAALALGGLPEDEMLRRSSREIALRTPEGMPNPLHYRTFIGLADAAAVIQDKLAAEVPPWVSCATVMPGVDLERFAPRPADPALKQRYGVADGERVIVYPGGLNDFTRPGLEALCRAVGLVNGRGVPCRLLRSGPVALDFLDRLPPEAARAVVDLGPLPREDMPALMALADVFVQPGRHDAFEDLRLPGKLPELFACGRPVVMPDTNIASFLRDGVDVVLHRTGTPEEMAEKCLELFADPARAVAIGAGGRRFAEAHFDPHTQAARLEGVYQSARRAFDPRIAAATWTADAPDAPVAGLLARRLRLLADAAAAPSGTAAAPSAAMYAAYAAHVESSLERTRALEAILAERDAQIASLKGQAEGATARAAAIEASLSWRITAPLRAIAHLAAWLRGTERRR